MFEKEGREWREGELGYVARREANSFISVAPPLWPRKNWEEYPEVLE
jgi:hypothetical protein